ncbi:hypothetical protein I925_09387 [Streptococcus sanguinis OH0843]|nr:hypothetical protein I925_09387 [Streptococcus sanguinis OH0843]
MFLLQIYLIVEFKIPYYSITNLKNSQTYFLKFKKAFVHFFETKIIKVCRSLCTKTFSNHKQDYSNFSFP